MLTYVKLNKEMIEVGIEAKLRNLINDKDCPNLPLGKEVKSMEQLINFNFWSKEMDYKPHHSAQSVLGINKVSKEQTCSTGCTSDQAGSQENGGMDCSENGPD